jgi:hypothetical protein
MPSLPSGSNRKIKTLNFLISNKKTADKPD